MPYLLPRRYRYAHDFSIFLHDLVVAKLRAGMEYGIFSVPVANTQGRLAVPAVQGSELYEWIEEKLGSHFTDDLVYRALIKHLVGDFCSFVLEGLRASAKGKLTVAYALLRKPFKDNLFYLEWLLADREGFLRRFQTEDVGAIADNKLLTPAFRLGIISAAIEATGGTTDSQFIYELRYDRKARYGLAGPGDKAIHLITLFEHIRTADQNFNFVFSGPRERETQWEHIYRAVPYLLHHAVEVIDGLFATIATVEEDYARMKEVRRVIGFAALAGSIDMEGRPTIIDSPILESSIADNPLFCPHCTAQLKLHSRNLRAFVIRGTLRCSTCRTEVRADITGKQS